MTGDNVLPFPLGRVLERGDQIELAMRLVAEDAARAGDVSPVTDERGTYHVWDRDARIWRAVDDHALECRVDEFAGAPVEGAKGPRPLKMKEGDAPAVVRVMRRHTFRPGFFRDDLVGFRNGVVIYPRGRELVVEPTTPEHGARAAVDVDYDPDWAMGDDALLARYLTTTFPDRDEQARILEIMGAALFGLGTRYKKAWFLADGPEIDGRGGTGKSQLLEMLAGLVPSERQCSVPPQDFADGYRGALLYGKTLNVVFEAPDTEILREEGVKAIVHGELITRRPIRRDPITFRPSALHVFACNWLPEAPGASSAFWDRWAVVEFNRRFRGSHEVIPHLGERVVRDELAHLVHVAIRGASSLLERGRYSSSSAGREAVTRWRQNAEPVAMFVAEWCEPEPTSTMRDWVSGAALYEAFTQWCKINGRSACSAHKFARRVPREIERGRSDGARYRLRLLDRTERERRDVGDAGAAWVPF